MRHARLALVAAILGTFGVVLGHEIVYDAHALLHTKRFDLPIDWFALLTEPYWYSGLWRPVTLLMLGLEINLSGGVEPVVLHATSLLMYVVLVLALMRISTAFGTHAGSTLAVAFLFAMHPLHVEVIASVVGQAEILTALAMMGAIAVWHRAAGRGASPNTLLALVILQLLAAGAKEQGYVLPLVLAGQHWIIRPRLEHRLAVRWLTVLILAAGAIWLVRAAVTGSLAGESPAPYFLGIGAADRVLAGLGVLPRVLGLLTVPSSLGFEYGPPAIAVDGKFGWAQVAGAAIILMWGLALWYWRERRPLAAFGLWLVATTWLPASSLIVPAGLLLADRVLFLPTIGLALTISSMNWPGEGRRSRLATVSVLVLGTLLAARSREHLARWRNAPTFFRQMTTDLPDSYRAWFARGNYARDNDMPQDAERYYREAIRLWPSDPAVFEELGQLLRRRGRCAEAIRYFKASIALDTARYQVKAKLAECEHQLVDP